MSPPPSHPPASPRTLRPAGGGREPGKVAGRYRIKQELARGGMGVVYRAFDESRQREVALKQLLPDSARTPRLVALFEREFQTLANLSHPRIIQVYEFGISDDGPYYTMELLSGGADLHSLAPLDPVRACAYLRDVATSLAILHVRGFVHRDVTPRNVLTTSDGHVKLLDFGALAPFGLTDEVVGTAPFIPPEVMRGEALDPRSDLFSLGALAYFLLTGQNAFPARRFEDLPQLWRERPARPSSLVPSIPARLDELVMALLSDDPNARPRTAAEVIEGLNAIAGLTQEPAADAYALAKAYLTNVRLVGREPPLTKLAKVVEASARGEPNWALILGEAGLGRTRLLAEASLSAQLNGAVVLRAQASHAYPFATAQLLASTLLDLLPIEARAAAQPDLAVLASLGPEFALRLDAEAQARVPLAVGQWGDQVFEALRQWFSRVAAEFDLVLAVDQLERADDASVAWLASFRREQRPLRICVLATVLEQESQVPSVAHRSLEEQAELITLEPLSASDTVDLLSAIFGQAPNLLRCSEWIHGLTAGRPLHCIELVDTLLMSGSLRFADGTWLLPAERPSLSLSHGLAQALSARLTLLSPEARGLAEALSLVQGAITPELCSGLAKGLKADVYSLLDELVHHRVLVVDAKHCRFANDAVRLALSTGMSDEARRGFHRELGELMLRSEYLDGFTRLMAGRHLMDGGDLTRGARCVYEIAVLHWDELRDTVHLAAPVIARAYDVFEAEGRSRYETFPLLMALSDASFYDDWRWGERYGARAIQSVESLLGIGLARRLSRLIGNKPALMLALFVASVRFVIGRPRGISYTLERLFSAAIGGVAALVGAAAAVIDREAAERGTETLRTLSWMGPRSALDGSYLFCHSLAMMLVDQPHQASVQLAALEARFQDPSNYRELPKESLTLWVGGVRYAMGIYQTMKAGDEVLRTASTLDQTGFALHRMFAEQLRLAYHMSRGEVAEAERFRKEAELHAVHVGSAWQAEIWEGATSTLLFMRSADVVNAKRVAERFADLSRHVPSLSLTALSIRAALHFARSEYALARDAYEQVLSQRAPRTFAGWLICRGALAACLNGLKNHEEALEVSRRTFEHMQPEDEQYPYVSMWVHIECAMAEAGLGKIPEALDRIERLFAAGTTKDNPFLHGSLHQARARLALLAGDEAGFHRHVDETRRLFALTNNPALSARAEQLRFLSLSAPWSRPSARALTMHGVVERLSTCTAESERAEVALEAILKFSKATSGALFRVREAGLEVAAETGIGELPAELVQRIRDMLEELDETMKTGTYDSARSEGVAPIASASGFRLLRLVLSQGAQVVVLGAVALRDAPELELMSVVELEQIARGLAAETVRITAASKPGARV